MGHISPRDNHHTDGFGGRWRSSAESTLLHFTSVTRRMGISGGREARGKCLLVHGAAPVTEGAVSSKGIEKREQGSLVGAESLELSASHKHPGSRPQRPAGCGAGGRVGGGGSGQAQASPLCKAFAFVCALI